MLRKLDEAVDALTREFGLTPMMAAEIECYVVLEDMSPEGMDAFWGPIDKRLRLEGLPVLRIEKERGTHQYEVITSITTPFDLVNALERIRTLVERQARTMQAQASFAAKPFEEEPSSGLHLHLHLADSTGTNTYQKTEDYTSDDLRFSIGGLLSNMLDSLPVFFPNEEDYARLEDVDHVPKIAGWGVNNRYCALRIPATPNHYDKRIEHRMPCANANPEAAIAVMLEGVLKGLRERIEPPEQAHGKRVAMA